LAVTRLIEPDEDVDVLDRSVMEEISTAPPAIATCARGKSRLTVAQSAWSFEILRF